MVTLAWIILLSLLMSAIALVGSITLVLKPATLDRLLLLLVAFAAGSLIGGALLHMIPTAVREMGNGVGVYAWIAAGFVLFLALEQFLQWHHSHGLTSANPQPLT
jgi:zinc and cadmium transporter